jgi:DNA-binding PadR family transcriptional regulator
MFGHHRNGGGHGHHRNRRGQGYGNVNLSERGKGRGRERMFEHGDLKLVVLLLLKDRPRHGYEIIKAIEELAGGDYTPSPGVVYPTLTLLEDLGHASVTLEHGGKKQYGITADGLAALEAQSDTLARVLTRLDSAGCAADARRAPELQRAMQNFKTALHFRLSRGPLSPASLRSIADAIDRAAIDIERCE